MPATIAGDTVIELDGTFRSSRELLSVELPESIKEIYGAFRGCTGLTSVELPEGLEVIGEDAFEGCTGLTDVEFPEGLKEIEDYAFYGCTGLTSVEFLEGLEVIGLGAFYGCTGLTSVEFSEGLEVIVGMPVNSFGPFRGGAFEGCTGLTSVEFSEGLKEIGGRAFYGCTGLTSVEFPEGLEEIGDRAFEGCTGLTSVGFPEGLKEIGDEAFSGCTGLTSLEFLEGLEEIGGRAFLGCTGLTSVEFPETLKKIGSNSMNVDLYGRQFEGCTGLTSVKFSEGLEEIGAATFRGCTGLTSLVFPESLIEIGECAFYGCTRLASVAFAPSVNLRYIRNGAFRGCDSIEEIEINTYGDDTYNTYIGDTVWPLSLQRIKIAAKTRWCSVNGSLSGLPNLERIELQGAFADSISNCSKLKYAVFRDSRMYLDEDDLDFFSGDSSLEYIMVKYLGLPKGHGGSHVHIPDLPNLKYLIVEAGHWPNFSSAGSLQEIVHLGADRYKHPRYDDISEAEVFRDVKVLSFVDTSGQRKFTGIDYRLLKVLNRHDTVYTYGQYPDLVVLPQPVSCRLEVDSLSAPVVSGQHALDSLDIWVDIEGLGKYKVPVEQDLSRYTGPELGPLVSYTIVKAPLRVVADTVRIRYGETVPELGYTMEGFVFGEDASVLESLPAVSCTAGSHPDAGTYPIEVSGGEAANYEFVYVPGLLIVEPASQEINWPQDFPQPVRVGEEVELQVSASSGLELSFDLSNPGLVSIEKRGARYMLTGVSEGVTDVTARQDGGRNYSAAEPVVKTIRVQGRLSNEEGEGSVQGRVYAKDRMLHFEGISGEVCVHTVAGTLVYQGEALPVSLPQPGVYIVRHGQQTEKVVVM